MKPLISKVVPTVPYNSKSLPDFDKSFPAVERRIIQIRRELKCESLTAVASTDGKFIGVWAFNVKLAEIRVSTQEFIDWTLPAQCIDAAIVKARLLQSRPAPHYSKWCALEMDVRQDIAGWKLPRNGEHGIVLRYNSADIIRPTVVGAEIPSTREAAMKDLTKSFPLFIRRVVSARVYTKCPLLEARLSIDKTDFIICIGDIMLGAICVVNQKFEDSPIALDTDASRVKSMILQSTPIRRSTLSGFQDGIRKDVNAGKLAPIEISSLANKPIANASPPLTLQESLQRMKELNQIINSLNKMMKPMIAESKQLAKEAKLEKARKHGDLETNAGAYPIIVVRKRRKK